MSRFLLLFFITLGCLCPPLQAREVQDLLGRKVNINRTKRIISCAPSITECIFALGQGDKLVGVSQFSNYPPQARNLPKIGSYIHLNLEKIVSLAPDLCLVTKDGNPKKTIQQLTNLGIAVYALDPRDIPSLYQTLLTLGDLLEAKEQATSLVASLKKRVQSVQDKVREAVYRPRVFFQIGINPMVSVGSKTLINDLISLAGGENVTKGPVPYPRISIEDVLVLNPDIIVISSMVNAQKLLLEVKAMWRGLPQIKAVQKNKIYVINSDLFNRPAPRIIQGLEALGRIFHPKLFGRSSQRQ